jgi:ABC-type taurine transport system substrate-binding protein
MSEPYTPTTDEARAAYVDRKDFEDQVAQVDRRGDATAEAEFERWQAAQPRTVSVEQAQRLARLCGVPDSKMDNALAVVSITVAEAGEVR